MRGELCKCGARGCLEAYVSKNALIIAELTNEIYKDNLFVSGNNCNIVITNFKNSYLLGAAIMPIEEFLELK